MDINLYNYIVVNEGEGDALTELMLDMAYLFHERGFVDFVAWDWQWKPHDAHVATFAICDYEVTLTSALEARLAIEIRQHGVTILNALLIMQDLLRPVSYGWIVPANLSTLDPFRVLLNLHSPVE